MNALMFSFLPCILIGFLGSPAAVEAQPAIPKSLTETVLYHDSLFWQAYNVCDVEAMKLFITADVEFYHDKAGLTISRQSLFESIRTGLCGNPDWRLRREAVPGSLQVFPLDNYGAILSGEHVFYIRETGKKERLDGRAKFTHVWKFHDQEWRMHRILSYDHGPAVHRVVGKEVALPPGLLKKYAGRYLSGNGATLHVTVSAEGNALTLKGPDFEFSFHPASEQMFFLKERDVQMEFIGGGSEALRLLIRENGDIVEEAHRSGSGR